VLQRKKRDFQYGLCYKTNSCLNLLIYNDIKICFFCGQGSESLDLQGFEGSQGDLSTKLSTEILDWPKSGYESKT
jgi:hypothetical protein